MPFLERMLNLDKLEREEDDLVEERNVHTIARARDLPVDAITTLLSQIKTRMAQSLDRSLLQTDLAWVCMHVLTTAPSLPHRYGPVSGSLH